MIGYVTVGINDLDKARAYYDALFGSIGARRLMEFGDEFHLYGTSWGQPGVAVCKPYNGEAATPGNGNMAAIVLDSRDKVDALHAKALELGGSCEGPPGLRGAGRRPGLLRRLFPRPRGQQILRLPHRARLRPADEGPGDRQQGGRHLERAMSEEAARIAAAFDAHGVAADVRLTDPEDLTDAFRDAAAAPGLDAVVAGGGDGTISCAAGKLAGTGRPLGILPLGTLNHLARDVGITGDDRGGGGGDRGRQRQGDRRRRGQRPGLRQQQLGRPLSGHGAASRARSRSGAAAASGWRCCRPASLRSAISAATGSGSARPGWRRRSARLCCSSATIATR